MMFGNLGLATFTQPINTIICVSVTPSPSQCGRHFMDHPKPPPNVSASLLFYLVYRNAMPPAESAGGRIEAMQLSHEVTIFRRLTGKFYAQEKVSLTNGKKGFYIAMTNSEVPVCMCHQILLNLLWKIHQAERKQTKTSV